MGLISINFFIFLLAVFGLYWFVIAERWRNCLLLLTSILFIASFSLLYTVYFLVNIYFVYVIGIAINKESRNKKVYLQLILIWLVGNLVFFKCVNELIIPLFKVWPVLFKITDERFLGIAFPLGISYIIFKLVHYIVEVYRNRAPRASFSDFALYVLFFPTFLAGPVERFQKFYPQELEKKQIDVYSINYGLLRMLSGIIKKVFISDNIGRLVMPVFNFPQGCMRFIVIVSIYALAIQIYMDFSAYTDIALGIARLFGYKITENFYKPFFQKNIALFWRNWHISVYTWIRDYFFLPIFGYRTSNIKIYVGVFCTMLVFMLWHKFSLNFLILGIYHGIGLVVWYFFQNIKGRFSWFADREFSSKYLNFFSVCVTFSFVGFGFVFFKLGIENAGKILRSVFYGR